MRHQLKRGNFSGGGNRKRKAEMKRKRDNKSLTTSLSGRCWLALSSRRWCFSRAACLHRRESIKPNRMPVMAVMTGVCSRRDVVKPFVHEQLK